MSGGEGDEAGPPRRYPLRDRARGAQVTPPNEHDPKAPGYGNPINLPQQSWSMGLCRKRLCIA